MDPRRLLLALGIAGSIQWFEALILRGAELRSLPIATSGFHYVADGIIVGGFAWLALMAGRVRFTPSAQSLDRGLSIPVRIVGSTVAFLLITVPGIVFRTWFHRHLDLRMGIGRESSPSVEEWFCSLQGTGALFSSLDDGVAALGAGSALVDVLRRAQLEAAVALTTLLVASLTAAAVAHGRRCRWRLPMAWRLACLGLLACVAGAGAESGSRLPMTGTSVERVAQVAPVLAPGAPTGNAPIEDTDPCESTRPEDRREYDVSAIDVSIVLNRFGDRDHFAYMYARSSKISTIDAQQHARGDCLEWGSDPEGKWLGDPMPCVSTGLRKDPIQPLVLRVNLGQCLVINFSNQIEPGPTKRINALMDRNQKDLWLFERHLRPYDDFASLHIQGLPHTVTASADPACAEFRKFGWMGANQHPLAKSIGRKPTELQQTCGKVTYRIPIPREATAERSYYFHDGGANRDRVAHGLFGVIVAEPAGAQYRDVETGDETDGTGWESIIAFAPSAGLGPKPRDFREFVLIYHEVGHEDTKNILDGTAIGMQVRETGSVTSKALEQVLDAPGALDKLYRVSGRAINYRSESFHHRLGVKSDSADRVRRRGLPLTPESAKQLKDMLKQQKSQGYGSYMFGEPATPMPRSYLGEPTKTRLVHGGTEVFHVHHLHGGATRWRRNPKADPKNDIASGLTKEPARDVHSTHLDSQSIGPGTSYNLEHECGAGGCQQAAGDFLFHCHIGQHYIAGMWGFWRVYDTKRSDLASLPDMESPPDAVDSTGLIGKVFEGKRIVVDVRDPATEIGLHDWVGAQLPSPGKPVDAMDASVWDWTVAQTADGPLVLSEPVSEYSWPNYPAEVFEPVTGRWRAIDEEVRLDGRRAIRFNPKNGRYTWPLLRPHLGQRPPFSPGGHSGAPWLGVQGSVERPDGLCPDRQGKPERTVRHYPISAVPFPVARFDTDVGNRVIEEGRVFVLNEEFNASAPPDRGGERKDPLVIRSNVGDCVRIILTSRLEDRGADTPFLVQSKVNIHSHFVQFDPQASDGVISGLSFEQSVRPFHLEQLTLDRAVARGDARLRIKRAPAAEPLRLQDGVWIGIGLGEGMCPSPEDPSRREPCTEIRKVRTVTADDDGTLVVVLTNGLSLPHAAGAAIGTEFVQYAWYSDVDVGSVFWHDHVDFHSWNQGLVGAHIVEPEGSRWLDPSTGEERRSGPIVDIITKRPSDSVGAGQRGSFREFVLLQIKEQTLPEQDLDRRAVTFNLKAEPIRIAEDSAADGRSGETAHWFSSFKHGDPFTPLPRAYLGDPFVIRHVSVVNRVAGLRVSGHRFRLERWAEEATLYDTSPAGISERFDLVLDGGAGGPLGKAGDFLYYGTIGRDLLDGAWGLIRVYDSVRPHLRPLPDRPAPPPFSGGFADPEVEQLAKQTKDNSGAAPPLSTGPGTPCPPGAVAEEYTVDLRRVNIFTRPRLTRADLVTLAKPQELDDFKRPKPPEMPWIDGGVAFVPSGTKSDFVLEPLVIRAGAGKCIKIMLVNRLNEPHGFAVRDDDGNPVSPPLPIDEQRAGLHLAKVLFDPQGSYGAAIGLNADSSVPPGVSREYVYHADRDTGTSLMLNLANPPLARKGAFGALVVEPPDAEFLNPLTGKPQRTGVLTDVVTSGRRFREFVAILHDDDPALGQDAMEYPTEAEERQAIFRGNFPSLSYATAPVKARNLQAAPIDVFNSCAMGPVPGERLGDPRWVIRGEPRDPMTIRVVAPWGEQARVFSVSGHRWYVEPAMLGSEQVSAHLVLPGFAFEARLIDGLGGRDGRAGDYLLYDGRLPFTLSGVWGLLSAGPRPVCP